MQNKLNEILELCIEKSGESRFYEFRYRTDLKVVIITTADSRTSQVLDKTAYGEEIMHQALEYMQNE